MVQRSSPSIASVIAAAAYDISPRRPSRENHRFDNSRRPILNKSLAGNLAHASRTQPARQAPAIYCRVSASAAR